MSFKAFTDRISPNGAVKAVKRTSLFLGALRELRWDVWRASVSWVRTLQETRLSDPKSDGLLVNTQRRSSAFTWQDLPAVAYPCETFAQGQTGNRMQNASRFRFLKDLKSRGTVVLTIIDYHKITTPFSKVLIKPCQWKSPWWKVVGASLSCQQFFDSEFFSSITAPVYRKTVPAKVQAAHLAAYLPLQAKCCSTEGEDAGAQDLLAPATSRHSPSSPPVQTVFNSKHLLHCSRTPPFESFFFANHFATFRLMSAPT